PPSEIDHGESALKFTGPFAGRGSVPVNFTRRSVRSSMRNACQDDDVESAATEMPREQVSEKSAAAGQHNAFTHDPVPSTRIRRQQRRSRNLNAPAGGRPLRICISSNGIAGAKSGGSQSKGGLGSTRPSLRMRTCASDTSG